MGVVAFSTEQNPHCTATHLLLLRCLFLSCRSSALKSETIVTQNRWHAAQLNACTVRGLKRHTTFQCPPE